MLQEKLTKEELQETVIALQKRLHVLQCESERKGGKFNEQLISVKSALEKVRDSLNRR